MTSSETPITVAEISEDRAARGRLWAARFAAFHRDHAGQPPKEPDPQEEIKVFLYGDLADPEALARFLAANAPGDQSSLQPVLKPARVLRYELASIDGADVLIPATWWANGCRFPTPTADGVVTTMRQAMIPALQAHYGPCFNKRFVFVLPAGSHLLVCHAMVWQPKIELEGSRASSKRTLFFYGSLADTNTLKRVLGLGSLPDLMPATLDGDGWQLRMWGQYPALVRDSPDGRSTVRGCVYECPGSLLIDLEKYEGAHYTPVQVQVTLTEGGQSVPAWCYVWNGDLDELREVETTHPA